MASYSTNPYNNFQAANSKEYISLDKGAKQDFRPETRFDILPGNSDLFCAEIEKCATQFGYGLRGHRISPESYTKYCE
jgi:hypothetical protein